MLRQVQFVTCSWRLRVMPRECLDSVEIFC